MKKLKIIFFIFLSTFFSVSYNFYEANASISISIWWGNSSTSWWISWKMTNSLVEDSAVWNMSFEKFVTFLKNQLLTIVFIIWVAMIVWVWLKMASANWNPEQFKKAWMHLVYIIIWWFVIFVSYWVVRLVFNLNIF